MVGTGLAPLKSMVQHIAETGGEHSVILYHGVATRMDPYDHHLFGAWNTENDWFSYRPALSRDDWNGRSGRVPALLAEDYLRASGHTAYVCGSPAMVNDTLRALMKVRLFPRDIYREDFFDSRDRASGAHIVRSPLIRRWHDIKRCLVTSGSRAKGSPGAARRCSVSPGDLLAG